MCALAVESVKVVVDYYFYSKNRIALSFSLILSCPFVSNNYLRREVRGDFNIHGTKLSFNG